MSSGCILGCVSWHRRVNEAHGDVAIVSLPEKVISKTGEKSKELQPPRRPPYPVRPPLCRTCKGAREFKACGRIFVDSGPQDDYDAMTKLGEGTFRHVLFFSIYA